MPSSFATRMMRPATSRTCPTDPGAPRQGGVVEDLHGVDHADLGALGLERGEHRVEVGLGDDRDAQRGPAEPLGAQLDLGRRFLAGDVEHAPPGGRQVAERPARERGLADPGRAADQDERTGHEPAAEHPVELADPGGQPRHRRGLDVRERDRLERARRAPAATTGAAAARRGRRPRLLDQRVPLAAAGTAPVPLGALVPARAAAEDGGRTRHAPRLSRAADDFAPCAAFCNPSEPRGCIGRSWICSTNPWRAPSFVAVDTETNGLAADLCELTEVGRRAGRWRRAPRHIRLAGADGTAAVARDPALHRDHAGDGRHGARAARGARGAGRAAARAGHGGALGALRPPRAARTRSSAAASNGPSRPCSARSSSRAASRRCRSGARWRRSPTRSGSRSPRSTARCPTPSPARACSAPCSRGCARTRPRSARRWRRSRRAGAPARPSPPSGSRRPSGRTCRPSPTTRACTSSATTAASPSTWASRCRCARGRGRTSAPRRAGPSGPRSSTTGPPTRSWARSCSRTG